MAKKKYYAVRNGVKPGIYETWAECELQVKGFSGAVYKSFPTMTEAELFMTGETDYSLGQSNGENIDVSRINSDVEVELNALTDKEVVAFVDGSYSQSEEKSGFGAIIIDDKRITTSLFKAYTKNLHEEFISLRNVAAELEGVKEAVNWAITYGKTRIKIYYDYEGIEKWADGSWNAKNAITRQYVNFIKDKRTVIAIDFCKVPAHCGIVYNEAADKLARHALLNKGYRTYNDGSIYFVGHSEKDWKSIIDSINDENLDLSDQNKIRIETKTIGNRKRLEVKDNKNKVVINCYSDTRSYVQGKQSVLFQKIISNAIELMSNEQIVIEMLNRVHVLTLTKEEVEVRFEQLLPDYKGKQNDKLYNNLLTAVYNVMLTGYMPDYTSLLMPIFRAYEYYLHRILGDLMGENTSNKNGHNNFGYFTKSETGKYECVSKKVSKLNTEQQVYLNELYNQYHKVRHPYSHWSVDDYDTAVITDIASAREILLKGLTLINKYYTLF